PPARHRARRSTSRQARPACFTSPAAGRLATRSCTQMWGLSSSCSGRGCSVSSSTRDERVATSSLAIVVVNYNDLTASLCCLESIHTACPGSLLVLVDNASRDDPREVVHSRLPETVVIRLERN